MNSLATFWIAAVIVLLANGGASASHRLFRSADRDLESISSIGDSDSDDVNNLGDFLNSPQWKELVELLEKLETLGNKEAQDDDDDINMDEWRQLLADMESPEFKAKWGIKDDFDIDDDDEDHSDMYKTPEWREFMIATATKEQLADPEFRTKWNIEY